MKKNLGYIIALIVAVITALIVLPAAGEAETRTAFLDGFNMSEGAFILKDEDGYRWFFALKEDDYKIGDEYVLHLPENGDPWYEVPEDSMSMPNLLQILAGLFIVSIGGGAVFCTAAKCDRHWQ